MKRNCICQDADSVSHAFCHSPWSPKSPKSPGRSRRSSNMISPQRKSSATSALRVDRVANDWRTTANGMRPSTSASSGITNVTARLDDDDFLGMEGVEPGVVVAEPAARRDKDHDTATVFAGKTPSPPATLRPAESTSTLATTSSAGYLQLEEDAPRRRPGVHNLDSETVTSPEGLTVIVAK
eukprot:m.1531875 g.1531875  ORF g.1531875 m.1531875 type:complete len:182 (-) comp25240_c0_seq80:2791-3336(-)